MGIQILRGGWVEVGIGNNQHISWLKLQWGNGLVKIPLYFLIAQEIFMLFPSKRWDIPHGNYNITSYWGITRTTPWVNKKYNSDIAKLLPDCNFNQEIPFPTSTRPTLRGFLSLFCMENYSAIELPVYGGESGPLTLFADLGHRHFLGSRL